MKKRIAISGKMASGKTTASSILVNQYGYQRMSFGNPIKKLGRLVSIPYNDEDIDRFMIDLCLGNENKAGQCLDILYDEIIPKYEDLNMDIKNDQTRAFMQDVGQSFKIVDPYIWANYLVTNLPVDRNIVIDDLRFKTELEVLKKAGFITVRLNIPPAIQAERIKQLFGHIDPSRLAEISEVDLDNEKFEIIIDSSKDKAIVERQIKELHMEDTNSKDDNNNWDFKINYYSSEVRKINIPRDLNPGTARIVISQISALLSDVIQDYHKLKSTLNNIDSVISNIEKKNLLGKNAEERKANSVLAVESVMIDGESINLYKRRGEIAVLLSKVESIRETMSAQQSLLVSMNGFMKLEKDIYGS